MRLGANHIGSHAHRASAVRARPRFRCGDEGGSDPHASRARCDDEASDLVGRARLDVQASLGVDQPEQTAVGCRCNHEKVPIRIEKQRKPRRDVARACGVSKLADKRGDRSGVIDRGWSEGDSRGVHAVLSSALARYSTEAVDRRSLHEGLRAGWARKTAWKQIGRPCLRPTG